MPRRPSPDSCTEGPLFEGQQFRALHAGVCLLALEWFRQLGLPCVSNADVLERAGLDTSDPEVVEDVRLRLMFKVQKYLAAGLILHMRAGA